MIVHLDASHYLTPLAPVQRGASFSHMAQVDFDGHLASAYVKLDRPNTAALFNEAIGYLGCRLLDIPAPAHAAILEVEPHQLAGLAGVPNWVASTEGPLLAWATEDMGGQSLAQWHRSTGDEDNLWIAVLGTPLGAQLSAFDEFLSNADRNAGNILQLSPKRFAAIDHGHLLGGSMWPVMGITPCSESDLLRHGRRLLTDKKLERFLQAVHLAAAYHPAGWKQLRAVVKSMLAYVPASEHHNAVDAFLDGRSSPEWMGARLGYL